MKINMKQAVQKIIVLFFCSTIFTATYAQENDGNKVLENSIGKIPFLNKLLPNQKAETETETKNMAGDASAANANCPSASQLDLNLNAMKRAKALAVKTTLNAIVNKMDLGEIELPATIANICDAEKRLSYIERSTVLWSSAVVTAVKQSAKALDIDEDIESYRAFANDDSLVKLDKSEIVSLRKSLKKDMKKIKTALEAKQVETKEMRDLLTEASANMKAAAIHGVQIAAWDKRMAEFMGENIPWTFDQLKRVKVFSDQMKLLGSTLNGMKKVSVAYQASHSEGGNKKLYDKVLAQRELKVTETQNRLTKEFQL